MSVVGTGNGTAVVAADVVSDTICWDGRRRLCSVLVLVVLVRLASFR